MMKSFSTLRFALLALLGLPVAAHAVTCQNSISASNPDSAYVDHGDGTVTHTPTGLMWKRCAEGQAWDGSTCLGSTSSHSWQAALDLAEVHSYAGQDDWRLPNVKELRSLAEECRVSPTINDTIFPATSSWVFWSGSPFAAHVVNALGVSFDFGSVLSLSRSDDFHVRLVRSGQSFAFFDRRLDATPDALGDYAAVTNATAGAVTASNDSKTVAGIDTPTGVSIAGEGSPEYRINGGAWTSAPELLEVGAELEVRLTAGAAGSTRVATLTVGGVSANFSVTVPAGGGDAGDGGGGESGVATLPPPTGPVSYACNGPNDPSSAATDPAAARPLSSSLIINRDLWLNLSFAAFAEAMDIYVVAELPGGVLLVLDHSGQWLAYPASIVPWRANSAAGVSATIWKSALADIPPGAYTAFAVVVRAGTDPASFNLGSSPYHMWCATRSVP